MINGNILLHCDLTSKIVRLIVIFTTMSNKEIGALLLLLGLKPSKDAVLRTRLQSFNEKGPEVKKSWTKHAMSAVLSGCKAIGKVK